MSLIAPDVPQGTHGGKGVGEEQYAPRPIANDLSVRQLSKVSVHLVGLVGRESGARGASNSCAFSKSDGLHIFL